MMRQIKISNSITNRDSASLERYLADISKAPLITADEEVELARRIKAGDREALEKLTTSNLRFVVSIAKKYQNQGIGLNDLITEGNIGLLRAAERFDETRGLSSFRMPCGGFASPYSPPSPNSHVWCVCPLTR